jgi:hypothetical protein
MKPKSRDPTWVGRFEARRLLGVTESGFERLVLPGKIDRSETARRADSRRKGEAFANTEKWAGDRIETVHAAEILGLGVGRARQLARADLLPYETDFPGPALLPAGAGRGGCAPAPCLLA